MPQTIVYCPLPINSSQWVSGQPVPHDPIRFIAETFHSLLVGLVQKYLHAANMIERGADEALKAEDVTTYKTFWGTLLSYFFSLFSGASVGPEDALGFLSVQVSQWLAAKLKFTREGALSVALAGMSSAYNGVVGEPVFAALLASEVSGGGKGGFAFIGTNLAAGAVGFLVFALLGIPAFAGILNIGAPSTITLAWVCCCSWQSLSPSCWPCR